MVCVDSWLALFDCRCLLSPSLGRNRRRNSLLLCGCLVLAACSDICFLDCFYDLLRAGQVAVIRIMYLSNLHFILTSHVIPLIFE